MGGLRNLSCGTQLKLHPRRFTWPRNTCLAPPQLQRADKRKNELATQRNASLVVKAFVRNVIPFSAYAGCQSAKQPLRPTQPL